LQALEIPINQNLYDQIIELGSFCTHLVIATDWDPQGESIGAQIYRLVERGMMDSSKLIVSRMRFTATNIPSLMRAFKEQYLLDIPLVSSVDSLRRQDLRMGASLTRFLTVGIEEKGINRLISYGPCQSSVLWIIVKKYLDKQQFEPKTYWDLKAIFQTKIEIVEKVETKTTKKKKGAKKAIKKTSKKSKKKTSEGEATENKFIFTWLNNPINTEEDLESIKNRIDGQKEARLISQEKETQIIPRPKPLDTDTLEADGSRYFRVSPKLIADIAEKLYNNGFITYPRTESSYYLQKDLSGICEKFVEGNIFVDEAKECLNSGNTTSPSQGKFSKDHEPIVPVKAVTEKDIADAIKGNDFENSLAWRIYEYIVRRFFATVYLDAELSITTTTIEIDSEEFIHKGQKIDKLAFLSLYPYRKVPESPYPVISGKKLDVSIEYEKKFTKPPELWTESQLIREMARLNIGTDATRSQHIATVVERGYAKVQSGSRSLMPTEIGVAFFDAFTKYAEKLILPEIRETVEQWILGIRTGENTPEHVDENVKELTKTSLFKLKEHKAEIFPIFVEKIQSTTKEGLEFGICLKCENPLILKGSSKGKRYLLCSNTECKQTYLLPKKGDLTLLPEKCHACPMYPIQVGSGTKSWIFCPNCWNSRQDAEGLLFCSRCEYDSCPYSQVSRDFSVKHEKGKLGTCPHCQEGEISLYFDQWRTKIECTNCKTEFKAPNIRAGTSIQVDGPCKLCGLSTLLIKRKGKATYNICVICSLLCFQCMYRCY
jgi:DNA topoisomerase IA